MEVFDILLRDILGRTFSFPVLLASVVSFWVFAGAGYSVWDADIWWHLRMAEYFFANHSTPRVDIFSYTTNGHEWINHEWLSEIPYYLAWKAAGLMGIYLLFVFLLVLIMAGIFYYAARESGNLKAAFIVSCFSLFLTVVSFGPRTILLGYVCLQILLLLLSRFRSRGEALLWVIPPLFCLWINTHGSWLLGMIVMGIFIVSGLVEGSWGRIDAVRWTPPQLRRLLVVTGASVAALFLNPFTYKLVIYPFNLAFVQKLNITYVDEWASVDFNDARGKVVMVLLAGIILGALLSRYRWKLHEFLLAGFALYAGLKHIRFLFLAAILLAPLLSKLLDEIIPPYRKEIDKPALNAAVMAILLGIVIYRFPSRADLQEAVDTRFPAKAVAYMQENQLKGNFFHRYMWGGYLIFFKRDTKTFIDGRTDIFEYTGVLKDYLDIEQLKGSLGLFDKYNIRYALVPPDFPIAYLLKNHARWKILYQDDVAMIFERTDSVDPPPADAEPAGALPNP